jgi:hypothetical protein
MRLPSMSTKVPLRAQAAQTHRGRAIGTDRLTGAEFCDHLRQVVQQVLGAHQAGLRDLERRDTHDRADRHIVRILLNARSGYHDFLQFRCRLGGGRRGLRKCGRCRCSGACHCDGGADCILQFAIIPHLLLP